jgi:hypothetical protein
MSSVFFALVLLTPAQTDRPTSRPAPWYERVLERINPDDTDYGALWEEWKAGFVERYVTNAEFQYAFWTTCAAAFLMLLLYLEHLSHRRSLRLAVDSIVDIHRYAQYARKVARDAIRRHNEHIEACNRMIEAEEAGTHQWIETAEFEALKQAMERTADELRAAREESKSLQALVKDRFSTGDDPQRRAAKPEKGERPTDSPRSPYVERINKLERELHAERQKNLRLKGTAIDARHH